MFGHMCPKPQEKGKSARRLGAKNDMTDQKRQLDNLPAHY